MDEKLFANIFHATFLLEFPRLHTLYFTSTFEFKQWGVEKAQQRFEQCVKIVRQQVPVAFTSLLIKRYTNKRMIDAAYEVANRTMKIIIDDVKNDDSLPFDDQLYMLYKLRSIKLILGYPEELLNEQNIEDVYKNLNLTGNESFLELVLESYTFSKNQYFRNFIKNDNNSFKRNETTRWIDYTTEDEYVTPSYNLNTKNSICKKKRFFLS